MGRRALVPRQGRPPAKFIAVNVPLPSEAAHGDVRTIHRRRFPAQSMAAKRAAADGWDAFGLPARTRRWQSRAPAKWTTTTSRMKAS